MGEDVNTTPIISLHNALADCWASKGRPEYARLHRERARTLAEDDIKILTVAEVAHDQLAIMAEVAELVK